MSQKPFFRSAPGFDRGLEGRVKAEVAQRRSSARGCKVTLANIDDDPFCSKKKGLQCAQEPPLP